MPQDFEALRKNSVEDEIRRLLRYDPATGEFAWSSFRSGSSPNGTVGSIQNEGYRRIKINYKDYLAHRLAWLIMTGSWPTMKIDHIDGDRLNNRWSNLRLASDEVNAQNMRRGYGQSGYLGVHASKGHRWVARITANGKRHCLGYFSDPAVAHEAYLAAKRRLHKGCTI